MKISTSLLPALSLAAALAARRFSSISLRLSSIIRLRAAERARAASALAGSDGVLRLLGVDDLLWGVLDTLEVSRGGGVTWRHEGGGYRRHRCAIYTDNSHCS